MGSFSIWHWLIVLAVVVLIFGTKKLKSAGDDLGGAVASFKRSMKTADMSVDAHPEEPSALMQPAAVSSHQTTGSSATPET